MRPTFDAALIGDLRQRVISHNEAHPGAKAKLGDLIKAYERGYRRSNPGVRAMEKVDGMLNRLAKADEFDESEHPRGVGGEFSSKAGRRAVTLALPKTEGEHKRLQGQNAGYSAMTSDVIPERRGEAVGIVTRDLGSAAAGAAVVGALAANKRGGIAERVAGKVAGSVAGTAAGGAASVVGGGLHLASSTLHGLTGIGPVFSQERAGRFRVSTARVANTAGGKVGVGAARLTGTLVRGAIKTAGNGPMTSAAAARYQKDVQAALKQGRSLPDAVLHSQGRALAMDRRVKFGRKALAFGALSLGVGAAIRSKIKDTIVDPAEWGRSFDGYSFRTVQKAVGGSDELGELRKRYTKHLSQNGRAGGSMEDLQGWLAADAGNYGELAKGGVWGRGITRMFAGAAGVGGAAAGAGAGYYASRVTQNRANGDGRFQEDEHPRAKDGKFTSKAGRDHRFAQVGGLLGGAAAAIGVWSAIRRHNGKKFAQGLKSADDWLAHRRATDGKKGGKGRLSHLFDTKEARITDHLERGEDFKKYRAALDDITADGASGVGAVQQKVKDAYFHKIAMAAVSHSEFQLPDGKDWKKIGDVMKEATLDSVQVPHAIKSTVAAMRNMDEATFQEAVKDLPAEVKGKLLERFREAGAAAAKVPEQLSGHKAALAAAKKHATGEHVKVAAAKAEMAEAEADLTTAPHAQMEAAKARHGKAVSDLTAAKESAASAEAAAKGLENNPTGVLDPITDKPIVPPTPQEITALKTKLTNEARAKAEKLIEVENAKATAENEARLVERHANVTAAMAAEAALNGSPRAAERAVKRLRPLREADVRAQATLKAAKDNLAAAQMRMDRLDIATRVRGGAKAKTAPGAAPDYIDPNKKVMSPDELKNLRENAPSIRAAHIKATKALNKAEADAAVARAKRNAALGVVRESLDRQPGPSVASRMMSEETRRDLRRFGGLAHGAAADFLKSPSGKKLRAMAAAAKPTAKRLAGQAYSSAKDAGQELFQDKFTRFNRDGERKVSWTKVGGGLAFAGGLYGGARSDLVTAATAYLHPDEEKRAAARKRTLNLQRDERIDPITGAGYFALHMPDPSKKGERTLIYGERFDDASGPATRLHAGATMSDVRQRIADREAERERRRQEQIKRQSSPNTSGTPNANVGKTPLTGLNDAAKAQVKAAQDGLREKQQTQVIHTYQGGPTVELRKDGFDEQNDKVFNPASGAVVAHIRSMNSMAGRRPGTPDQYHGALRDMFSDEASVLKAQTVYRELTGHDVRGNVNKNNSHTFNPIFVPNPTVYAGGDAGKVGDALGLEVTHALGSFKPSTPEQFANLHRAIAVVGRVKNVSQATMDGLHQRIRAAEGTPAAAPHAAPQPAPAPAAAALPADTSRTVPVVPPAPTNLDGRASAHPNEFWDDTLGTRHATMMSAKLAPLIGFDQDAKMERKLSHTLHGLARALPPDTKLDEQQRVDVIGKAMLALHKRSVMGLRRVLLSGSPVEQADENRLFLSLVTSEVMTKNPEWKPKGEGMFKSAPSRQLGSTLLEASASSEVELGSPLDDLETLLKLSMGEFEEQLHPRAPAGNEDGGEFTAGHGGGSRGGKAVAEAVEGAGKVASRRAGSAEQSQAWDHPVRMGAELGGSLGSEVGIQAAQALTHRLPGLAGKALGFVADGVAAMVAGDQGSQLGERAGQAAYRASNGTKGAPEYTPPEASDAGEAVVGGLAGMGAGMWGNAAGATAGKWVAGKVAGSALAEGVGLAAGRTLGSIAGMVGGPVGSILLGTAAGYAGEKLATGVYDLFAGYDKPAVNQALARVTRGRG